MKHRIEVYQEHGTALCLQDGAFIITFFPQQLSFKKNENGYAMHVRPSLVEADIDKEDFVRLKPFSQEPTAEWLYDNASSALKNFSEFGDDIAQKKKMWEKLKREMDLKFNQLK